MIIVIMILIIMIKDDDIGKKSKCTQNYLHKTFKFLDHSRLLARNFSEGNHLFSIIVAIS